MTLEEKASLCSGQDMFHLKGLARLGVPGILLSDGPHGIRKDGGDPDHLGLNCSVPATCFPTAGAMACSWDRSLMFEIGRALGEECLSEAVDVLLGPGINIKRSPLCGRNFEYLSEDPYLTGELAASLIEGIQSQGVGATLKHFAVNNQEHRRMTIDSIVDERTLREIYLAGFERTIKKIDPWSVMGSYNQVNGSFACENKHLLASILREEWGYQGVVMTDWGACNDRVAGLKVGLDLEMPSSYGLSDAKIVDAVKSGNLAEATLDRTVERLLGLAFKAAAGRRDGHYYDKTEHHILARQAAAESMVLLKNEGPLLPLRRDMRLAVIGSFSIQPRYQGTGSSQVNPFRLENAYCELIGYAPRITFSEGYDMKSRTPDEALIRDACAAARGADVAIVYAGLSENDECEGADREHLRLPESHDELIRQVAGANPNTVVVLANGSPVEMPWIGEVKAVLEGHLGGQAGGGATADVLFGLVNPSGKLAETYARKLEDYPSSRYFPSGPVSVEYREGIYVGYRYFDKAKTPLRFPFGHGLSYTTFAYSALEVSDRSVRDDEIVTVGVSIKNTGPVAGGEVVQLYVRDVESTIFRPEKELKGFDKIFLEPGEEYLVRFTLDKRAFAYYHAGIGDWHVESGDFELLVGGSSADIRLRETIRVETTQPGVSVPDYRLTAPVYYDLPPTDLAVDDRSFQAVYGAPLPRNERLPGDLYTVNSAMSDIKNNLVGRVFYDLVQRQVQNTILLGEDGDPQQVLTRKMIDNLPLRNLPVFSNGKISVDTIKGLLLLMNRHPISGLARLSLALLKSI